MIMIVNPTKNGWEIIYHRAHALLAAQIAGQWQRKNAPLRLYETIAAISHHDDLEKEWEENCLTEAGAPMDFTFEEKTDYDRLRKHIEAALYRGRWVAILNSIHQCRLNQAKEEESPEAKSFLKEQRQLQNQWRKELGISKDDVDDAYAFMQWCDRLSLILCMEEIPDDERAIEIGKDGEGQRYDLVQNSDGLITVTPWCFESDRFTVKVEVTYLSQMKFDDNASLIEALRNSPRKLLEWTFKSS
jgi:hypothetical protein